MPGQGFKLADAYVEIHADDDAIKRDVDKLPGRVGPNAERAGTGLGKRVGKGLGDESARQGKGAGDKLSKGMEMALVRNSPLIAAAIAGALTAGAPIALAGVGVLFGGIAALAASQSVKVQSAWLGAWEHIKTGAIDDASVLESTMVGTADRTAASFDRMGPVIRRSFAASGPIIDGFVNSVLRGAEHAMPLFVRSLEDSGPAFAGMDAFIEKVTVGVGQFFADLSTHSPAAGQAFSELGDTMDTLLPILAELLGQGSELAADVLPLLNGSLGMVLGVTRALGPALPAVAKGFLALTLARGAASALNSASSAIERLAIKTGQFDTATGRVTGGLGRTQQAAQRVAAAVPLVSIATVGLVEAFTAADRAQEDLQGGFSTLFDKLRMGGAAAAEAREQIATLEAKLADYDPEWGGTDVAAAFNAAKDAAAQYQQELDPITRATDLVRTRTADLQFALETYGLGSDEAAQASGDLARAQQVLENAQSRVQMATDGVTDAMIRQADQALAGIDSTFAYENSVNALEDAQLALTDAQNHLHDANENTRTSSEDVSRAQLALEEQAYRTALSFGQQQADLSGLEAGSNQYKRMVQEQMLIALEDMRQKAGPEMAAALQQQIDMLRASGVNLDQTGVQTMAMAQRARDLGIAVTQIPGQKFIQIDAPTADQEQRLRDLGYHVQHMPNGSVYVTADTSSARASLNAFLMIQAIKRIPIIGVLARNYADGGPIRAATGRKVFGPGGPRDDMINATGPNGSQWNLSNGEWIINALASSRYGDAAMAAINAGRATVTVPSASGAQAITPSGARPGAGAATGGATISVGQLHVHVDGTFDLTKPEEIRRAAIALRRALLDLERETR